MNALRSNRKAAIAAILVGDLLMLLLGWFVLIGPQRAQAKQIAQSTAVTESQVAAASKPVVTSTTPAAVQPKQPDIRTADLYALAKAMPNDEDTPDLLLELNLLARQSGVTLSSFGLGAPTSQGSYSSLPITLTASGDFYSLTDYLYRLRTLVGVRDGELQTAGRLYSVGAVSIGGGSDAKSLSANVTVSAYLWGGDAAAASTPAAAPTDTTTTDTTSSEPPAN